MDRFIRVCKALSDRTRVRIMVALIRAGKELCICEIMDTLKLAQYNISRHVKELKAAGLVRERKEGRFVYYSPVLQNGGFEKHIVKALEAIDADAGDDERLEKRLSLRKNGACVVGMRKSAVNRGTRA